MTKSQNSFPEDLRSLLEVAGVSGYEQPVVQRIRSMLPQDVIAHDDAIGNLTASFGTGSPHLLLIVHTDEVGFVVSGVREDGAVYLSKIGHWDLSILGGSQVDIHTDQGTVHGVVITVPPHLDTRLSEAEAWIEGDQIVVDVGGSTAEDTTALGVEPLHSATLARHMSVLPGGHLVARGLDNRFGCFLLVQLARRLAERPPERGKITLAWSSQEEVGFRGPRVLAHADRYDAVLAIDAFPAERRVDTTTQAHDAVHLGAGPVLRGVDLTGVATTRFVRGIARLARESEIPIQPAYALGHNQASVFPQSVAAALDLPIAYLHSGAESLHVHDLEWAKALLEALVDHPKKESLWS